MVDINDNKSQSQEIIAKLLIIGDSKVGKSSILTRFTENFFSENTTTTVGIDYKTKRIHIDGTSIKLQIWDTAGQERYRCITKNFYKNTMGVIIAFDLTDQQSFENVKNWLKQIKLNASDNVCKLLLGNKCDLEANRAISKEELQSFIKEINIDYFDVSAKNNININEAFYLIAKNVKKNYFGNLQFLSKEELDCAKDDKSIKSITDSLRLTKQMNDDNNSKEDNRSQPKCC